MADGSGVADGAAGLAQFQAIGRKVRERVSTLAQARSEALSEMGWQDDHDVLWTQTSPGFAAFVDEMMDERIGRPKVERCTLSAEERWQRKREAQLQQAAGQQPVFHEVLGWPVDLLAAKLTLADFFVPSAGAVLSKDAILASAKFTDEVLAALHRERADANGRLTVLVNDINILNEVQRQRGNDA